MAIVKQLIRFSWLLILAVLPCQAAILSWENGGQQDGGSNIARAFFCPHFSARSLLQDAQPFSLQLPNLTHYPPAIRAQLTQAYDNAKAHPAAAIALGKLGMALQAYGEHQTAAACFARAQQLAPQELRWVYYSGLAQLSLSNTAQALVLFRQASDYLPAQIKAADILFAQNKLDEAEALYRAAAKKNPTVQGAWYGLGRVQAARQDLSAASNSFERAVSLSPQFGAAHYALALVLRDAGRLGKAKEHLALYQQYKLIRPSAPDPWLEELTALNLSAVIHLNRGLALEADGDLAASIKKHEKALEVDPMLVQAHLNLIQLYGRLTQAESAEKHYRAALLVNPNLVEAHYNFGVVQLTLQKTDAAKAAFTRTLASDPQHAEAHFNLGVLSLQETKLEEAAQHFQAAIAGNPNFRQAHFELGRILVHQNRLAEAIQHFEQTLAPEDNETARFMYALAATYARAGKR